MLPILCFGNGTPTNTMPLSLPATNVCTSIAIPKLQLSRGRRRVAFVPVICSSEGSSIPSRNADSNINGGKIWREMTGASLVLACAVGFFNASLNMNPKAIACLPPGSTTTGKAAMGSLMEVFTTLSPREKWFPTLPADPTKDRIDFHEIKKHALWLVKSGKASEAEVFLQRACDIYYKDGKFWQPAFDLEMILVEILIYQGRYMEALDCKCLGKNHDVHTANARIFLYQFIAHAMLDQLEEANEYWEKYKKAEEDFGMPPDTKSDKCNSKKTEIKIE